MATGKLAFDKDEKVLCFHGPLVYEAKVLKADWWTPEEYGSEEGPHYFVHYKGWKQTWDEWVPESRLLKFSDANLQKQQELQSSYARKKEENRVKEKKADGSNGGPIPSGPAGGAGGQGRKRVREIYVDREEEFLKRAEIRIPIPDSLKVQLVDDWEHVTKHMRLVSLPREPTVTQILDRYKQTVTRGKPGRNDILQEVLDGLKLYFDKALGTILLYRYERQQYADVMQRYPGKAMSDLYGAEHLLRLFVQLPMLIAHTTMDQDSVSLLKDHLNNIILFIQSNAKEFFLKEYENSPLEYLAFHRAAN